MAGAQIKRFLILHKELDADDGELTRTQKVRRGFIAERYAPLIKALYDGSKEADISTEVTFEDGRKGMITARVKIRDMKIEPSRAWRRRHDARAPHPSRRSGRKGVLAMSHRRRACRSAGADVAERGDVLLVGRECLAVVRRREGDQRRLLRHPQGRDPRHHRPERRRQDLDAQRHQRLLSAAAGPHHLQGQDARQDAPLRRGPWRHRAHLPERRAVPRHDRARQHHGRPHAEDARGTSSGSCCATARR